MTQNSKKKIEDKSKIYIDWSRISFSDKAVGKKPILEREDILLEECVKLKKARETSSTREMVHK